MGHLWPSAAKPASMPVYPLRRTGTKPLEGARKSKAKAKAKARRPDSRPDCRPVRVPIVGASLLAMDVQAARSSRQGALSLTSIASKHRSYRETCSLKIRSAVRPPRFGFRFWRPVKPRWPNAGIAQWLNRQDAGLAALGQGRPIAATHGAMPSLRHAEPQRGTEWWGKSVWLLCAGRRSVFQSHPP